MKKHLSGSAILAGYAAYKELWAEVPGTGQSIMDLMNAGYSRLELARYFPFTLVNIAALMIALTWAVLAYRKSHAETS